MGAGLVGLGAAAVVIPLLAAPAGGALAVGGVVGGSILAVGAFLKALQQLRDWGLVNFRPAPNVEGPVEGTVINAYQSGNGGFAINYKRRDTTSQTRSCDPPGLNFEAPTDTTASFSISVFAKGIRIGKTSGSSRTICGTSGGSAAISYPAISTVFADGGGQDLVFVSGGRVTASSFFNRQNESTETIFDISITVGGQTISANQTIPAEFAPGTRPRLFPPVVPDAPVLPAPATPLETPVLPPPPDRRPLAPPVTAPRPGQQPARVPVPGPRPRPSPSPGPGPVPAQPAPAPIPAIGPLPAPRPLPVPTTPAEVVVVDGQPIGGPGLAPAPNLVAIAQELGRLERKNEILLSRPENGGLGDAAENSLLAILRGLLERLVTELLSDVPGGSFTLTHACPPTGGGDPLPPVEVPYSGGGNPTEGILAKLDGIAGLIQAHKNMGQPTCKTAIFGEEVTVHFESDS